MYQVVFGMVLVSLQMATYGDFSADFGSIPVVDVDRYVSLMFQHILALHFHEI